MTEEFFGALLTLLILWNECRCSRTISSTPLTNVQEEFNGLTRHLDCLSNVRWHESSMTGSRKSPGKFQPALTRHIDSLTRAESRRSATPPLATSLKAGQAFRALRLMRPKLHVVGLRPQEILNKAIFGVKRVCYDEGLLYIAQFLLQFRRVAESSHRQTKVSAF